ncbi:hypothetical protein Tco_0493596 [Tanacetum coccineum]
MLTMAENVIAAGADNCPPMLDKSQYSSWQSRMLLYIKGKEHGKQLYDSVIIGPFKYGRVEVPETPTTPASIRDRTYDDLTEPEKICEACDIRATNIVLQGLPQDIYNLPEWSKFVTDVKLAKDLHNTNFDQLYAHLRQHEAHANEVRLMRQQFPDPLAMHRSSLALVANPPSVVYHQSYQALATHPQTQESFPQLYSGLVVPSFLPSDDPIASLNKAMAFISTTFTSRYPPTNNQLRTRLTQGIRQLSKMVESPCRTFRADKHKGEGHMARQCTKPKRPKNSEWFKEKMLLAQALESGVVLDEEQMEFLADNEDTVTTCQESQELTTIAIFQTDDLDSVNSDCDEAPSASAILMAKLSAYDSDIQRYKILTLIKLLMGLIKVCNKCIVQDTPSTTQQDALIMFVIEEMSNQVAKCNEVNKENKAANESLTAELERYKEQINFFEERQKVDLTD